MLLTRDLQVGLVDRKEMRKWIGGGYGQIE